MRLRRIAPDRDASRAVHRALVAARSTSGQPRLDHQRRGSDVRRARSETRRYISHLDAVVSADAPSRRTGFERRIRQFLRYNQMSLVAVASEYAPPDSVVGVALGVRCGRQDRLLPDRRGRALVRRRARDGSRFRVHARVHAIEVHRRALVQRLLHDASGRYPRLRRQRSSEWKARRRSPPDELMYEYSVGVVPKHFHQLERQLGVRLQLEDRTQHRSVPDHRRSQRTSTSSSRAIRTGGRTTASTTGIDSIRTRSGSRSCATSTSRSNISSRARATRSAWSFRSSGTTRRKGRCSTTDTSAATGSTTTCRKPSSGMFLNEDDPILKDRNVRIALAYAMNFDKSFELCCATTTRECRRSTRVLATTTISRSTRAQFDLAQGERVSRSGRLA